jgi:hypothetical protein
MERGRKGQRAFTLITALAFSLIVGTVLAGIGTVSMSHLSRAKVEGDYANAVALADGGINYELAWISRNTAYAQNCSSPRVEGCIDQMGSPYTGAITGIPGNYSVYVRPWGSNCDGTGNWSAPGDMCIDSTGTVNGISRTVRVRGVRKSIFDEYALYAYKQGTFSGGGASGTSTEVVGDLGTNGGVTFNGTLNTDIVNGTMFLNGGSASSSDSGNNLASNPDPVLMPDISQLAALQFPASPTGLSYLAANNNNANIRMLSTTDTAWASEPTIAGMTLADVMALPSAGFTASSRSFTDPPNSVAVDSSTLDSATGSRFMTPADATYGISAYGVQSLRIYLVPPGDYYFSSLDFKSGTSGLVFLTHLCTAGHPIRIWIDNPTSGAVKDDNLSVPVVFTDTTPSKFRLFYNKCANLSIGGNSRFNGGFYALNSGCTGGTPNMKFTGNSMIYGSVITDYFTVSGGTKVVFPNNGGGADPTDFSLWFGFKDNWKEVSPNANPVFVDGTNN